MLHLLFCMMTFHNKSQFLFSWPDYSHRLFLKHPAMLKATLHKPMNKKFKRLIFVKLQYQQQIKH